MYENGICFLKAIMVSAVICLLTVNCRGHKGQPVNPKEYIILYDDSWTFNEKDGDIETNKIEDIVLNRDSLLLAINEKFQLYLTHYLGDVIWVSTNPNIALVEPNGMVIGKTSGIAAIQALFLNEIRTCTIEVSGNLSDSNKLSSSKKQKVGHEFVDLGLSVKWATMNIGAETIDGYGDYFAWGELQPKTVYTLQNYSVDRDPVKLQLSLDAANYYWGGSWRIPTEHEWKELRNGCSWKLTTVNGVEGHLAVSLNNGNSIFFPSAGFFNPRLICKDYCGMYWSSNRHKDSQRAWCTVMDENGVSNSGGHYRKTGMSVRAVCE